MEILGEKTLHRAPNPTVLKLHSHRGFLGLCMTKMENSLPSMMHAEAVALIPQCFERRKKRCKFRVCKLDTEYAQDVLLAI